MVEAVGDANPVLPARTTLPPPAGSPDQVRMKCSV